MVSALGTCQPAFVAPIDGSVNCTDGNDIGSLRIASSLSGAVPSVAMLEQAAATLVEEAKQPVDDLADLLCRKPLSDAQITRRAILTFSLLQ